MVVLGRAGPAHWSTAEEIALATRAPIEYLRKILQRLVRSGILASGRGRRGGFRLVRDPAQVSLLELFESIHGPIGPEAVFGGDDDVPEATTLGGVQKYQCLVCDSLRTVLASRTLSELLDEYSVCSASAEALEAPHRGMIVERQPGNTSGASLRPAPLTPKE
jgi:Rrf2 family protein